MQIAYAVVAVVYSPMLVMSVRLKLVRDPRAVEVIGDLHGVPLSLFPALATLELAGAIGLWTGSCLVCAEETAVSGRLLGPRARTAPRPLA